MEFPFMNCQFHYQKIGNYQPMRMMTFAAFVQMVETYSFVIYVPGPSTQVGICFCWDFLNIS